jgi:CRISPR/Cas system-associated endonuclease Cas1
MTGTATKPRRLARTRRERERRDRENIADALARGRRSRSKRSLRNQLAAANLYYDAIAARARFAP